jgi:hypothetical protein
MPRVDERLQKRLREVRERFEREPATDAPQLGLRGTARLEVAQEEIGKELLR